MSDIGAALPMGSVTRAERASGAACGVLAAAAGLGVGEGVASALSGPSAVEAVWVTVVDATPGWLRDWAISSLGTSDKAVLVLGVLGLLGGVAGTVGGMGMRHPRRALGATLAVGGAALAAAAFGRAGSGLSPWSRLLPAVLTLVVSALALAALLAAARARRVRRTSDDTPIGMADPPQSPALEVLASTAEQRAEAEALSGDALVLDRRRFLVTALAVGSVGAVGGAVAWRAPVPAARGVVPVPADRAAPLPAGADLHDVGMAPFHTPTNGFYRVDTSLRIPRVDAASWRLHVHGMVDRDLVLDLEDLLDRRMVERDITLTCVSNEVGGPYVGTARWIGARIDDLLAECGVRDGADAVLSTAVDGFTIGTPLAALTDGRDALLVVAMNGEPLPPTHGFPVRMVVPGLYGYVSATKWLVDLEVTRFADVDAYWTRRGWAEQAPIKTSSRIDHPRSGARLNVGHVSVAGVAWAQRRGVTGVEVRVDDGPWLPAELGAEATIDTWRQWRLDWEAPVGSHELTVRATDATGETQTPDRAPPAPDGATGWHTVVVDVFDGIPTGPPPGGGAPATGAGPDDANLVR